MSLENNILETYDKEQMRKWTKTYAETYSDFKNKLEQSLKKDYYWAINEKGKGSSPFVLAAYVCFSVMFSDEYDLSKEYAKALENEDTDFICLCCYFVLEKGHQKVMEYFKREVEKMNRLNVEEDLKTFKKLDNYNRHRMEKDPVKGELNLLVLRRWHYNHKNEYERFLSNIEKAHDGDMTFVYNNILTFMDMLNIDGVKNIIDTLETLAPGTKQYEESILCSTESLYERINGLLKETIDKESVKNDLLHRNPNLFCVFYWIRFDNGLIKAVELLNKTVFPKNKSRWGLFLRENVFRSLILSGMSSLNYNKSMWKKLASTMGKNDVRKSIVTTLEEVGNRHGRNKEYVLLEEMLIDNVQPLLEEIRHVLVEWRQQNRTDTILAYIFAALSQIGFLNKQYAYRTFHFAMREKFPNFGFKNGYDQVEAMYNAIIKKDGNSSANITDKQINKGRSFVDKLSLKLKMKVNPSIID